jgi:hypothetical protein
VKGTRSAVELIRNRSELVLAEGRQINALGEILPYHTVDFLKNYLLLRAMRFKEVHLNPSISCQLRMSGHPFALVIGQCLAHRLGNASQFGRETLKCRRRRCVCQLSQHLQSSASLDQHTHGSAVALSYDEVALPMTRKRPVFGFGWKYVII